MDIIYPKEVKRADAEGNDIEMGGDTEKRNGDNNGMVYHEPLNHEPSGFLETTLARLGGSTETFMKNNSNSLKMISIFVFNGAVIGYFFGCLYYWMTYVNTPLELCSGFGSLIAFLSIIYFFLVYFFFIKKYFGSWFHRTVWRRLTNATDCCWKFPLFRYALTLAIIGGILLFLIIDSRGSEHRLISLIGNQFNNHSLSLLDQLRFALKGLVVLLLLGFLFSKHPGRINWRSVSMGLLLQFAFGLIFIRWDTGRLALQCFSDKVCS
ncbi:unnamed protein product [Plutella xylostella]|uniref:(diamondback moth) hypothetical protein n=1 Tax=Plutella xylostella TaxID=51655 RepID=A0A8S4G0Y6_PLUXY|nr:unnamed protein product [Plutella xylostella]